MVTSVGTGCIIVGIFSISEEIVYMRAEDGSCTVVGEGSGEDTILLTGLSWGVSLDATCEAIPYKEGGLPLHSSGNQMIS